VSGEGPRAARIGEIVCAVARQCMADRGARLVALLDDASPEAELAALMLERALGAEAVLRVTLEDSELEPLLHLAGPGSPAARVQDEARRMKARLVDGAVTAHPANRTELLLGPHLPPETLLPLGDLYASEVAELAGGWSASPEVRALAAAAGGIEPLDAALRRWLEARDPNGLDELPVEVAKRVQRHFRAGRAARLAPRVIPKMGTRTIGVDLLE
jgi:hypothetical protein